MTHCSRRNVGLLLNQAKTRKAAVRIGGPLIVALLAAATLYLPQQASARCSWKSDSMFSSPNGVGSVERRRSECSSEEALVLLVGGKLVGRLVVASEDNDSSEIDGLGIVWLSDASIRVFVPFGAAVVIGDNRYADIQVDYSVTPFSASAQSLLDANTPGRIQSVDWRRNRREARERDKQ